MVKLLRFGFLIMTCTLLLPSCNSDLFLSKNVKWTSFENIEAMKGQKMVLVELYTPWCGYCKRMEENTFKAPDIAKYMNKNFFNIKFDAESKDAITFDGKTYKFDKKATSRGRHELATALMKKTNKKGYPTIAFLDENYNLIQAVPGYKNAQEFEAIIHYFGEKHYKDKSWDDFYKQFNSSKDMSS